MKLVCIVDKAQISVLFQNVWILVTFVHLRVFQRGLQKIPDLSLLVTDCSDPHRWSFSDNLQSQTAFQRNGKKKLWLPTVVVENACAYSHRPTKLVLPDENEPPTSAESLSPFSCLPAFFCLTRPTLARRNARGRGARFFCPCLVRVPAGLVRCPHAHFTSFKTNHRVDATRERHRVFWKPERGV